MSHITTVTLNAAIDKTYYMERFPLGKVSRVTDLISAPGGKGINVAKVARQLGASVTATGFIGGNNGEYIRKQLTAQGIEADFVHVEGESRLCLNMIDLSEGTSTELLEPGPVIRDEQIAHIRSKVSELASSSAIVAMSGSLPKGVPSTIYAELIELVRKAGALPFLDTSSDALLEGIKAKPYFIKPNEDEVEKLIGRKLENETDLYDGMLSLQRDGISCVVVTLGAKGSVAGFAGQLYRIYAPQIDAVNPVGSGDSFVAGMATALAQGLSLERALLLATACGTANALNAQAGDVRQEDITRLLEQVRMERIHLP